VTHFENTLHASKNGLMSSKLTKIQVSEIYASNEIQLVLADKYSISKQTISAIKNGKCWNHITNHKKQIAA
jgi:hypothetical protein